jgi:glycerophosphoryl diester phosphodiesterase
MKILCIILAVLFLTSAGVNCKKTPKIIVMAHRGASSENPENTKIAVRKAGESGADYSEIDVHQTRDGKIILMHDETLDRTTSGKGYIWDHSWEEIRYLDAGSWFGEEFQGEPVPSLEEIIRFASGRIKLNIEIKISKEEPDKVSKVMDIIDKYDFRDECVVTSFDRMTVEKVKEIDSRIQTGFIFGKNYPDNVFTGSWDILSCNYKIVDEAFVQKARENKKKIYVWTVDQKNEMLRLIGLNVDAIITNKPGFLLDVLRELKLR